LRHRWEGELEGREDAAGVLNKDAGAGEVDDGDELGAEGFLGKTVGVIGSCAI